MHRRIPLLCCCLAMLLPGVALGQAAAPIEDRPATKFNEVERGLYFGAHAGGGLVFGPEAKTGSGSSVARSLGITAGIDLGDRLSVGLMMLGAQIDTPLGFESPSGMRGDFSTLAIGALAEVGLLSFKDVNGVPRVYVRARGGGGLGLMGPQNFYADSDILVVAGAGLEYFTHLRHFSVGLDADFLFGVTNLGPGFTLSPSVRYTF